jgi:hypothetical protein
MHQTDYKFIYQLNTLHNYNKKHMKNSRKNQNYSHEEPKALGPVRESHLMKPQELAHELVKYTAAQKSLARPC